jgi:hypothetical protein
MLPVAKRLPALIVEDSLRHAEGGGHQGIHALSSWSRDAERRGALETHMLAMLTAATAGGTATDANGERAFTCYLDFLDSINELVSFRFTGRDDMAFGTSASRSTASSCGSNACAICTSRCTVLGEVAVLRAVSSAKDRGDTVSS